ncbi:MAG: YfhO family protein, partial [Candidatus Lindowbacteria bacterium]|nr:YfhO family protein [Candidatus Lindowbacteria bacterium]
HIHIGKYGINEVELRVAASQPSIAVLTDCYYPGWSAFVDGERRSIWRANSLFRAVEVPPGDHTIVLKYRPASLCWGLAISISALLSIVIVLVVNRYRPSPIGSLRNSGSRNPPV